MPSDTFFRLPPQKRETLLACAREEFARVSYPEASINRIIHNAHIPRGSFYMYFTDKADLFFYLMDCFADRLAGQLGQLLEQEKGDLFATVLALFDRVQAACHQGGGESGWGYSGISSVSTAGSRWTACPGRPSAAASRPCWAGWIPGSWSCAGMGIWRICSTFSWMSPPRR